MKKTLISIVAAVYKSFLRPLIFLSDSENIHNFFTRFGEVIGKSFFKPIFRVIFYHQDPKLSQQLFGISFISPIGLAAGFDYQAKLMDILPALSFGFETIGTITNLPYEGNPKPRLGRLIKTKSLMVNKGFKNDGIAAICRKLMGKKFSFPVGISIGKTNTEKITTQGEAVKDIVSAFRLAEKTKLNNSFYELNISCPNLFGNIEFYQPQHLRKLLQAVFALKLSKPVFIKMPISNSDEEILQMMEVITDFPVKAVIIGNLQKDRTDNSFVKEELAKFSVGNFSGMPTQARSNELIKLVYQNFGRKITIIGCGGVFSAKDAYEKIKAGANLVQLITGLIFEGPQLVTQINYGLSDLLKKDGFNNISQAVGKDVE